VQLAGGDGDAAEGDGDGDGDGDGEEDEESKAPQGARTPHSQGEEGEVQGGQEALQVTVRGGGAVRRFGVGSSAVACGVASLWGGSALHVCRRRLDVRRDLPAHARRGSSPSPFGSKWYRGRGAGARTCSERRGGERQTASFLCLFAWVLRMRSWPRLWLVRRRAVPFLHLFASALWRSRRCRPRADALAHPFLLVMAGVGGGGRCSRTGGAGLRRQG
jgi:hypothetical protein